MSTTAEVRLWGSRIGAVTLADGERIAQFAYDPAFARSSIEVAPLTMPLAADRIYGFPSLNPSGFHGLPGLLADALPDKYGNTLINAWLATQGRTPDSFNARRPRRPSPVEASTHAGPVLRIGPCDRLADGRRVPRRYRCGA